MSLKDDTRGRVPFALIGVLLLLGSTTYATTLATDGVRVDRDVEVAMDRATAASETALRAAVTRAARDAARTPVVVPATNQWGDALDASRPFRDALRVRIYVAARTSFDRTAYTHGDVTAAATLPPTPTPAALERALDRVALTSVEDGTALRVRVRNVSVVARQGDTVVARENTTRTVTVATPMLALHDRTVRFEQSLDRGVLEGPGLGRRLTTRLYPIAWARGYAQWGGAPISNVVGTRHVGITANGAILELQQEAYGRADPSGREAQKRAFVRLGQQDVRAGVNTAPVDVATAVAGDPSLVDPDDAPRRVPRLETDTAPTPDRERRIAVNTSADRAFVEFRSSNASSLATADSNRSLGHLSLATLLERAYTVDLRLRTHVELIDTEPWPQPRPPTSSATLVNETVRQGSTVENGVAALPGTEDGWTRLRTATRHVTVRHRIERTWVDGGATMPTSYTVTERYAVGLAVDGRPTRLNGTPPHPIDPVFERGGALDGPNLANVADDADEFLDERGGVGSVATRSVVDGVETLDRNGSAEGARPATLSPWVAADLVALNREVRTVSATVRMADVATASASPAARLAARLEERRTDLVAAPQTYDGVADRARVAARVAYLDRVRHRLQQRANASEAANERLTDRLRANYGVDLPGRARETMAVATTDGSPPAVEPASFSGPLGGDDVFVPQGGPAYLDVQGVDATGEPWSDERGVEYPMQTRNINVFTVPYGDAVDAVVGASASDERSTVRLHTAALTLRAAEHASAFETPELHDNRTRLNETVAAKLRTVGDRTRTVLATETTLSRQARNRVVSDAFSRWNRPSARALAVTNGSFSHAVVDASGLDGEDAVWLRTHLRVAVGDLLASNETRVEMDRVETTTSAVREVTTITGTEVLGTAVEAERARLDSRYEKAVILPAGLPLLPTPTNWYATVNVWVVRVSGTYPRFAVRTQRGVPGETVTYVRDGRNATVDVDADGDAETLGTASPVQFSVRTVVLVAVPPGRTGVGDTDGQASETSPGWGSEWPT